MTQKIELSVGGMTCASCSRRVEKVLAKIPGVSATVNYATGSALIEVETQLDSAKLITAIENIGYTASLTQKMVSKYGVKEFRDRLLVSSVLTIPLMLISMISQFQFSYWQWVSALLATPVATWGAWPFHRASFLNLRHKAVTMDTLVSMGVSVSYLWSLYAILFTVAGDPAMKMVMTLIGSPASHDVGIYFEVSAAVTTLVILGKYLEHKARDKSTQALETLATLNPKNAILLRAGQQVSVLIEDVKVGDELYVQTGSQIPVDGIVITGKGYLDKSLITGESLPLEVTTGDSVIGATVLISGALTIKAVAIGKDSMLSSISRLVHQAQTGKAEVTKLVDRVAEIFVPIVIILSVLTGLFWLLILDNSAMALTTAIAVLVIACPCALGLATPTALLVGSGRGAALGILIRGPHAIESSQKIDRILIDKTGTLTDGQMSVSEVTSEIAMEKLWQVVDALEATSTHPIATSLRKFAHTQGFQHEPATQVKSVSGSGVQGLVEGITYQLGSSNWHNIGSNQITQAVKKFSTQGDSVVVLYQESNAIAVIAVSDQISNTAAAAITKLKDMNITPIVISGDHEMAVKKVCDQLGITQYYANSSPAFKLAEVTRLQDEKHFVAMIGDGVNDAAALAKAHLSLAMGAGTDVAASAADIVLMRSSMAAAVDSIALSKATMRTIKTNLFWAFAYNVAAIPLAMVGLLGPIIASAAMAFSSVFVVTNSLRLRKFKTLS
jgi:Cu+-exporting ATPase